MTDLTARPTSRPFLFGITILPFSGAVGYVTIAAPFWLAHEGVSLTAIGAMSATSMLPHAVKFLWAPLVDIGSRRRAWYVTMTVATGLALVALALVPTPATHMSLFTLVATLAQITSTTAAVAADGLMAVTTAESDRGAAAGWRMAGNVGGTGLLGALILWVASTFSVATAGLVLGAVVLACAGVAPFLHEARGVAPAAGTLVSALGLRLREIARDLWSTVKSRDGYTGLVICLAPVGAGALTNLFSAMAVDYRASEGMVAMVNGLGGGIIGAVGSLVGGVLSDRMNRRLAYALSGGLTAFAGIAMLCAPMTPTTYAWGTLAYSFANGIAFTALAAFILEMVGESVAAATKYTLFIAVANVASSYVTALDGWASEFRGLGSRGALAFDALLTFVGVGLLLVMVRVTRRPVAQRVSADGAADLP